MLQWSNLGFQYNAGRAIKRGSIAMISAQWTRALKLESAQPTQTKYPLSHFSLEEV